MSKYYTPSIEEFRVGFEYEWSRDGEGADWSNSAMTVNNGPVIDQDAWRINKYRVKYLDRSDIESCGFVHYNFNGMCETFHKENVILNFYIGFDGALNGGYEVSISKKLISCDKCESTTDHKLFNGKIKNINELHQVLDMIEVEYES